MTPVKSNAAVPKGTIRLSEAYENFYRAVVPNWQELANRHQECWQELANVCAKVPGLLQSLPTTVPNWQEMTEKYIGQWRNLG